MSQLSNSEYSALAWCRIESCRISVGRVLPDPFVQRPGGSPNVGLQQQRTAEVPTLPESTNLTTPMTDNPMTTT